MFSIDLLKGKGKGRQIGLRSTVLKAVLFLIPVVAVVAWAASYQQDCIQVKHQQTEIHKNQETIDNSTKAVKAYYQMKAQSAEMRKCLDVITKGLSFRIQTSDLMVELVQTLPEDVFIYEIDMDRTASLEKVQHQKTGEIKRNLVIQRKLKLIICGYDSVQSDQAVREYVSRLKKSAILSEIFTDIKPSARQQGAVEERSATYYEIECILRKQG